MISVFPFKQLGNHSYGWLNAHYHFSFANYYDPERCGFLPLIVWNDDTIQSGTGFPMHSHRDMEIITYVRKGAISHEDSLGNKGETRAGEIQIMSAGKGITHSEQNLEDEETLLFQIWIQPNKNNIQPRWENIDIHLETKSGIHPVASGEGKFKNSQMLNIHQDTTLYVMNGAINDDFKYELKPDRHIYLVVSKGSVNINTLQVNERDGVRIIDELYLNFIFRGDSELIILDLPNIT